MKRSFLKGVLIAAAGTVCLAVYSLACTPNDPKCGDGSNSIAFNSIQDINTFLSKTDSNNTNDSYTGSFDITQIVPTWDSADTVLTATLKVLLKDDKDLFCDWFEAATLTYEVGQQTWNTVWSLGFAVPGLNNSITSGNAAGAINPDHILKYTITATLGDFYIDKAVLSGRYCDYQPQNPVPEPATMLLFGTGIAGLAGIVRRRITNIA